MEAILPRSRYGAERPARKLTLRGSASAFGQVLLAALQRMVLRQQELPPEFFRYPLP
jgi:hypothetical protein